MCALATAVHASLQNQSALMFGGQLERDDHVKQLTISKLVCFSSITKGETRMLNARASIFRCGILTVAMLSTCQASWDLTDPAHHDKFGNDASIGCTGSGPANESFVLKVYEHNDTTIINSASGSVSSLGDWNEDVDPPTSGTWWDPEDPGIHYLEVKLTHNGLEKASEVIDVEVEEEV